MTGPPTCSSCRRQDLLWERYDVVAGPGNGGECYWHSKIRALSDGGLPEAPPEPTDILGRMLQSWDQRDEREAMRLRGVTYSVRIGGETRELTV